MLLTFSILAAGLVLATLLPLWRSPHWLVRGWEFPRLQIAVVAFAVGVTGAVFLDRDEPATWVVLLPVLGCFLWQGWWILPYTLLWAREVRASQNDDPERRLRILTANVLTPNRNADALCDLVERHRPDVLVTLETDAWWEAQLDRIQDHMPHVIRCPLDNLYGMHVYSRLPLEEASTVFLVEEGVPSMHALARLACGVGVRMHFLHPSPPSPTENPESTQRDAELVLVAKSVARSSQPIVVTGDLNDVAWSATTRLFRKISRLLDPRVGRGMYNTFHASLPFLRWPLDHIFHSHHFGVRGICRLRLRGSDHMALLTELVYVPEEVTDMGGLDASASDHARAGRIEGTQDVGVDDVPGPGESDGTRGGNACNEQESPHACGAS